MIYKATPVHCFLKTMLRLLLITFALGQSESFIKNFSHKKCSVFAVGKFSNGDDCNGYYKCLLGVKIPGRCTFGKIFDCKMKKCTYPDLVTDTSCCTFRNHTVGKACFVLDLVTANFFDCTTYYRCIKWRIAKYACPKGMKFNFLINNCVGASRFVPCLNELIPDVFSVVKGIFHRIPALVPSLILPDDEFDFGIV